MGFFSDIFNPKYVLKPKNMDLVIGGLRYQTEKATLIASQVWKYEKDYPDSELCGDFLYRTPNGRYFTQKQRQKLKLGTEQKFDDKKDVCRIESLTQTQSIDLYEKLPNKHVAFAEAFPSTGRTQIEDA